jgi:hypothetical protein
VGGGVSDSLSRSVMGGKGVSDCLSRSVMPLSTMSVTSMSSLSTTSATVCGGDGGWMQISALKLQHFLSVRVSQNLSRYQINIE